jgi:hypothetical protein
MARLSDGISWENDPEVSESILDPLKREKIRLTGLMPERILK